MTSFRRLGSDEQKTIEKIRSHVKLKKMDQQLKIYDTASRKKREFKSLNPPQVKIYCCGPTVYDYLHIGNFRGAVFFNLLRNWLKFLGYQVEFIYNFTDIDDKILNRASQENLKPSDIAKKYIQEFQKDFNNLKLEPHTHNPKATETMEEIISLIQQLIQDGKAYEVEGDVFYSVDLFKDYGYLSGRNKKDLLAGARVEINNKKQNPLDFSLWKKSKPKENWFWDSPWGQGRPGWHIECTAMIHKFLGPQIDIHGGGSDLIFPHHENEIAQSEACTHKKYASYWMHNNMIVTSGDKMSKSLGNIMTMREFLNQYHGEIFKYLILSCHYRSQLQFSDKTIAQSTLCLAKIYSHLLKAQNILNLNEGQGSQSHQGKSEINKNQFEKNHLSKELLNKNVDCDFQAFVEQSEGQITQAFNDDFATPKAFAVFFNVLKQFSLLFQKNISLERQVYCAKQFLDFFKKYGQMLSLFQEEPSEFLKILDDYILKQKNITRQEIDKMVASRSLARDKKDFKASDQLRDKLQNLGVKLKDSPHKTTWELDRSHE